MGIDEHGQRKASAFCVGERENQQAWEDLKRRGVEPVDLCSGVRTKNQQEIGDVELKAIFYQDNRVQAEQELAAFLASMKPSTQAPWPVCGATWRLA